MIRQPPLVAQVCSPSSRSASPIPVPSCIKSVMSKSSEDLFQRQSAHELLPAAEARTFSTDHQQSAGSRRRCRAREAGSEQYYFNQQGVPCCTISPENFLCSAIMLFHKKIHGVRMPAQMSVSLVLVTGYFLSLLNHLIATPANVWLHQMLHYLQTKPILSSPIPPVLGVVPLLSAF